MIDITNLTKAYGRARGVTDLTLHVPGGSCYGFIGPNGAGKSTRSEERRVGKEC